MQELRTLLAKFAHRVGARCWTGATPEVRESKIPEAILAKIDLPDIRQAPFSMASLVALNTGEAAHVLAVAGSTSLAYGSAMPRAYIVQNFKIALTGLGEGAMFFGNGKWETAPCQAWEPLTSATFECGVIGFNDADAFVFWVEEED